MRTNKVLYGLMAFGPILLTFIGIAAMFGLIGLNRGGGRGDEQTAVLIIVFFAVLFLVSIALSVTGLIMYIIHASKNPRVPEDQRIAWIIGMVMLSGIANIVYFFMYIANEQEYIPPQQNKGPWD